MTSYQDLELEDFIRFCSFSKNYISKARTYYLTEAIHRKYLEFEKIKTRKSDQKDKNK